MTDKNIAQGEFTIENTKEIKKWPYILGSYGFFSCSMVIATLQYNDFDIYLFHHAPGGRTSTKFRHKLSETLLHNNPNTVSIFYILSLFGHANGNKEITKIEESFYGIDYSAFFENRPEYKPYEKDINELYSLPTLSSCNKELFLGFLYSFINITIKPCNMISSDPNYSLFDNEILYNKFMNFYVPSDKMSPSSISPLQNMPSRSSTPRDSFIKEEKPCCLIF